MALQQTISSILNDGKACGETLKGTNISGIPPSGTPVAGLKNRSGTVVVNSGKINNLLNVSFALKNPSVPSGTGVRTGNVDVEMVITKLSSAVVMGKTVTKTIPLTVEVDGSGNLLECRSTLDSKALNIKLAAKKDMCADMGGVWDIPTKSCSIVNLFQQNCQNIGGNWDSTNKKCKNVKKDMCTDMGGVWDIPTKSCSIVNLFQQNCQNIGGNWDSTNKKCKNVKKDMCTDMGGVWDIPTKSCSIVNLFQQNCQNIGGNWDSTNKKCSLSPMQDRISAIETKLNRGFNVSFYSDGNSGGGIYDNTKTLGSHMFCTVSGVSGPGGHNTLCKLSLSSGTWSLRTRDGDHSGPSATVHAGETHHCYVVCIDYFP